MANICITAIFVWKYSNRSKSKVDQINKRTNTSDRNSKVLFYRF